MPRQKSERIGLPVDRTAGLLALLTALAVASAFLFATPVRAAGAAAASPGDSPEAKPSPTATPTPAVALADIADQAEKDTAKLAAFEPAGGYEADLITIGQALQDAPGAIQRLNAANTRETGPDSSLEALRGLQSDWNQLADGIRGHAAALVTRAKTLQTDAEQTQEIQTLWLATESAAKAAGAPPETIRLTRSVLNACTAAAGRIKEAQARVLEMQVEAGQLLSRTSDGAGAVRAAITEAVNGLLVADSPPLWSHAARVSAGSMARHPETLAEQWSTLVHYASGRTDAFVIHCAVFLFLLGGAFSMRRGLRRWTEDEPGLKRAAPFLRAPIAAAVALSFAVTTPLYSDAPTLFHAIVAAAVLLPTVIILHLIVDQRLYRDLYVLVAFFLVEQLRRAIGGFPSLNRWIFCVEMLFAILVSVRLGLATTAELRLRVKRRYWLAAALLAAALAADVVGFTRLGVLLGMGVLRGAYLALVLYALQRVLEGLIFIALRVRPLTASHIARQHRETVERQASLLLSWVMAVAWAFLMLSWFQVRAPFFTGAQRVLDYQLRAGSVALSLGQFLSFAVAIWLSFLVSRLVRFLLNEEIYERVTLAPGLPYAISTMLNYMILLIGFVVALGLLGVDLTKITIVAGAFSVGLGFGLQNVINNFVSGIILLFERPIKVGDVIQIGDATGEVRRIGIRASIVSTKNGSDIIVPNGNLISNQVTNWTYTNRRGSVEVPLSVAPGADPQHVIELLKTAARAALERGDPEVYVTGATALATTFIVRVWTDYTGDPVPARSQLSLALMAALARERIPLV